MRGVAAGETIVPTPAQNKFVSALADVLVYIVVLNLFIEYVETVVIDSFTVSILTAVLLWLMLEAITGVEHRVAGFFRSREGWISRVLGFLAVWGILIVSKFVILEAVGFVFGGRAALGHFVEVVLIILAMILARASVDWIYQRLGRQDARQRLGDESDAVA